MDSGVKRLARLMPPAVAGAAVYQVNVLLVTMLASLLAQGSVSYLYYADRLVQFPLGVFGVAIGVAALPSMANLAASGREGEYGEVLRDALGLTLCVSLPATAGLIALSEPIVAALFRRGSFDAHAVTATASALDGFCVGLPAFAVARPLVSAFYARQDTRTPLRAAALSVGGNIVLALALTPFLQHVGLALAASLASWINVGLLLRALGRTQAPAAAAVKSALPATARMLALSALCGLLAWASWRFAPRGMGKASLLLIPLWIFLYLYAAKRWTPREASLLLDGLLQRLRRSPEAEK
jgi:putative peptidoglycan lipid II flippase